MFFKKGKIITLFFLLIPLFSFAQNRVDYNINVNPTHPRPGQNVFVSISSSDFDVDRASTSWELNGKSQPSFNDKTSFNFTSSLDGLDNLSVKVTPQGGTINEKNITIRSGEIDLMWEVLDSYTPPFYKGKGLPIDGASIRVTAIPNIKDSNGKIIPARELTYKWSKDGKNINNQSGYGKNVFSFGRDVTESTNNVSVTATSSSGSAQISKSFKYFKPEIIFYENSLVDGPIFQRALTSGFQVNTNRISLIAEPFYLSKSYQQIPTIRTTWTAGGQVIEPVGNTISFSTAGQTGVFPVIFEYDDTMQLFRDVKKEIKLNLVK